MLRLHCPAGLENDEYVRQIDGYLPTCEVAFIDEIFKANSAILNALLTLLNERLFDNGNQRLRVPLLCMVSRVYMNRTSCVMSFFAQGFAATLCKTHARLISADIAWMAQCTSCFAHE